MGEWETEGGREREDGVEERGSEIERDEGEGEGVCVYMYVEERESERERKSLRS